MWMTQNGYSFYCMQSIVVILILFKSQQVADKRHIISSFNNLICTSFGHPLCMICLYWNHTLVINYQHVYGDAKSIIVWCQHDIYSEYMYQTKV